MLLEPVSVNFGVRRQIFQALVGVQNLLFFVAVEVIDGRKTEPKFEDFFVKSFWQVLVEFWQIWKGLELFLVFFWQIFDHFLTIF